MFRLHQRRGTAFPRLANLPHIAGVKVIGPRGEGIEIETPRYDLFTRVLVEIAHRGGSIRGIAGNDEIMVSLTMPVNDTAPIRHGTVILRIPRDTIPAISYWSTSRCRISRPSAYPFGDPGPEHVLDY